jgi:hypothetical protein
LIWFLDIEIDGHDKRVNGLCFPVNTHVAASSG